jgi:hypothetical protein
MAPEKAHAGGPGDRRRSVAVERWGDLQDRLAAMALEIDQLQGSRHPRWRTGSRGSVTPERAPGFVATGALFALATSLLIGGLLRFIWTRSEQRLLDSRRPVATSREVREWSPRPAGDVAARVLYIVARDQPELFAFLRQDFAAEEAEGVIEILVDRRQGAQRCAADGRDPRRNGSVSVDLREMGFAFVRRQARSQRSVGDRLP